MLKNFGYKGSYPKTAIAQDSSQFLYIILLGDNDPTDPVVYRVVRKGRDRQPKGEELSSLLADLEPEEQQGK